MNYDADDGAADTEVEFENGRGMMTENMFNCSASSLINCSNVSP